MRRLRPAIPCLLLLGAGAVFAAEGGAPLEQTKQELQKLRSEQGTGGEPAATEGLKSGLPGIASPADPGLPFQLVSPEALHAQEKKKNEASRNWLVEGMAKLERESQRKGRLSGGKEDEAAGDLTEEGAPDTSDPAFLLKTYERNKSRQEDQAQRKAANGLPGAKRTDPMAPFMQDWLAHSPVRNQILQSLGEREQSTREANRDAAFELGLPSDRKGPASQLADNGSVATGPTKTNPYLVELGQTLSVAPAAGTGPQTPDSASQASRSGPAPATPGLQPLPEPPPASKKPLPPALSEDKKYFPQLKKF